MHIVVSMQEGKDWELIHMEKTFEAAKDFAKKQVQKSTDVYGIFHLVGITEFKVGVKE